MIFMATREQLIKANKKALLSPRIGKRGKNKKTIAIEDARRAWAEEQLAYLPQIIQIQRTEALKPENRQEREYVLNQLIGRATETIKVMEDIVLKLDI